MRADFAVHPSRARVPTPWIWRARWMALLLLVAGNVHASTVGPGRDYWETTYGYTPATLFYLNVPAGVFGPTSLGYDLGSDVTMTGLGIDIPPCASKPVPSDVVINRTTAASLSIGSSATIPITVERMMLIPETPTKMTVFYTDRDPVDWWFRAVELQPIVSSGSMTIHQDDDFGGTFDMQMYMHLQMVFSDQFGNTSVVYNIPSAQPLACHGIPWRFRVPFDDNCPSNFAVVGQGPYGWTGGYYLDRWIAWPIPLHDGLGPAPVTIPIANPVAVGFVALGLATAGAEWIVRRRRPSHQ